MVVVNINAALNRGNIMALTTDFSGTYDYEAGEANNEFDYLMEIEADYTIEEMQAKVEKLQIHWLKVLGADGFRDFSAAWNQRCNDAGLSLGYYMIA